MKAQNITIGIRKTETEEYEGYLYYREKALASIKGQKKVTKTGKHLIELYFEGKKPETQVITRDDGTEYTIDKPDVTLFLNITKNGNVSIGGDLVTDFGLWFPIQGWLDKERMSVRLTETDYINDNFKEQYGEPVTDVPEVDFSDEDLALSDKLFPVAAQFYFDYVISKKDARFTDKLDRSAPNILTMKLEALKKAANTRAKTKVAQGQLNRERPF